jgi:epoxyqueuosine reductase
VKSSISKWFCRHSAQEVCPFNIKFSRALSETAFEPREILAGKDARTLATEVLAMDDEEFRTAFRKSLMKRAKRSGLARNAAVVLANTDDDTDRVLSI